MIFIFGFCDLYVFSEANKDDDYYYGNIGICALYDNM